MSGGKGGSQSTKVTIPQYIEDAARRNLARAEEIAEIGYMPYYGPEVAAFNPMQTQAFQNTANAAAAFGMGAPTDVMAGMPQAQDFGNGMMGYGSGDLFQGAIDQFAARNPQQYNQYAQNFTGPYASSDARGGPSPYSPYGPARGFGGKGGAQGPIFDAQYSQSPSGPMSPNGALPPTSGGQV